jgi:chloramphenicol 3-O-phosphotransferase
MCYPERADDPGRYRLQTRNLATVVAGFRAAGARCVVVSGVLDPDHGVHRDLLPDVALTVCRLRTEPDELTARFTEREGSDAAVPAILANSAQMDRTGFADVVLDTTATPVPQVARRVRERTGNWPGTPAALAPSANPPADGPDAEGPVLLLCGASGAGKSTVGWQVYQSLLGSGRAAAFVDLAQIGFCRPAPPEDPGHQRLRARNLAGLWRTFRDAGTEYLIAAGPIANHREYQEYTAALPAARVTLCRLHAGREQLSERIRRLGRGEGWPAPGDPLRGRPEAHLRQIADRAAADAAAMRQAALGDLSVETDGRSPQQIAAEILARAIEPAPGPVR